MATVTVHLGLPSEVVLPDSQLIVVGSVIQLKSLPFESLKPSLGGLVTNETYTKALERVKEGCIPLYLDLCYLVGIPTRCSHHGSPARGETVASSVSSVLGGSSKVVVVGCLPVEHVVAFCRSVAKVVPLYSRRTKTREGEPATLNIHLNVTQGSLTETDISYLNDLCLGVRECAKLVDMPCSELNTDVFVDVAKNVAKDLGDKVSINIIRGEELLAGGFGGIYHVGKAASFPPALVILSYSPKDATETYSLVGKGIVYDTGGMQIKTKTGMPGMKRDMGGSAAMLHAFRTLVKAQFQENLHCLLCLAENMIGKDATKPDDIIRLLSGKQVEINNTDAEGRLVLADGVYYAHNILKSNTIIDMATLTGAQATATGNLHAAVVTNQELWERKCSAAGRASGDLTHPLPFYPEVHLKGLHSAIADLKNSALGKPEAGSAVAALFIGVQINFDENTNWVHIDMAAPVNCGERATGYGVALIDVLLGNLTQVPLLKMLAPKVQ